MIEDEREQTKRGSAMVTLLERAFSEAAKLPESEQEQLAAWILTELASERRWQESFAQSVDVLERLGAEALAEHEAGQTQPLDPERL
jgi:hypothetical protein